MAIGPALTGVYLENKQTIDGISGAYPSPESYNLVYLTSASLSAISLIFVFLLKKRTGKMQIETATTK
jgi:hypothetical protein